jgi:PEP-CTERM motif
MKLLKKAWLGLAFSAGVLASGAASATAVCTGCAHIFNPGVTFGMNVGVLDPTTFDNSSFTHTGLGNGLFSDWWVFTVTPAGLGGINAVFLPTAAISGFNITLWSMTANNCAAQTGLSTSGACNTASDFMGGNLTAVPGAVNNGGGTFVVNLPNVPLSGSYAFNITGNSIAAGLTQPNLYSGNVTTTVIPEPGSLALAALGLLAAGVSLRRRT